jgi:kumamolisin
VLATAHARFVQSSSLGHVHRAVQNGLTKIGPTDPQKKIKLFLTMAHQTPGAAHNFVMVNNSAMQSGSSVKLLPQAYESQFCQSGSALAQDIANLTQAGLTITRPGNCNMEVSATVEQVSDFLNIRIYDHSTASGDLVFATIDEPVFPKGSQIVSVVGLDNITKLRRIGTKKLQNQDLVAGGACSLAPSDIIKAYSLTNSVKTLNGSGQTVAIVNMAYYDTCDINNYLQTFYGKTLSSGQVTNIAVGSSVPVGLTGASVEPLLDLSMVLALAPSVNILVYQVNGDTATPADTLSLYAQIANDNKASVMTTSWSWPEDSLTAANIAAEDAVFMQMAAQGQTVFAASGDTGDYQNFYTQSLNAHPPTCGDPNGDCTGMDPATQTWVTGVGGTILSMNGDSSYKFETTWGPAANNGSGIYAGGSGGGVSQWTTIPCYQQQIRETGSRMSKVNRNIPDVALNASLPYAVFANNQLNPVGGTSAAAPLWAGFIALVNQQRQTNGKERIGFLNNYLYAASFTSQYASIFHDIADGCTNGLFPSVTGYDLATGLGSFIGDAMLDFLVSK